MCRSEALAHEGRLRDQPAGERHIARRKDIQRQSQVVHDERMEFLDLLAAALAREGTAVLDLLGRELMLVPDGVDPASTRTRETFSCRPSAIEPWPKRRSKRAFG